MNLDEPGLHRPVARQPRGHLREPDRRARRGRHRARRSQGRAQHAASAPGERVVLADIDGPGHDPPHLDDVPAGAARGHAGALHRGLLRRRRPSRASRCRSSTSSACRTDARSRTTRRSIAVQEGRGFNSYVPMPFGEHVRIEATNGGARSIILYYQVDYTLAAARRRRWATCTWRSGARTRPCRSATSSSSTGSRARVASSAARRRPRDRRGRLVRRGRGEGVPRRRRRAADDLRHRARGLRRQRVGHGRAQRARTAARRSASVRARPRPARLRRLLPLARARPDHVRDRPAGHDPADRREVLPARRRGHARGVRDDEPGRGRGLALRRRAAIPRVGHRRAGRRLLRDVLRVLPAPATGAPRSTSPPRSPTSNAARGRPPIRWRRSPP